MTGVLLWKEYRQQRAVWLAIAILATSDDSLRQGLEEFRRKQSEAVLAAKLPG